MRPIFPTSCPWGGRSHKKPVKAAPSPQWKCTLRDGSLAAFCPSVSTRSACEARRPHVLAPSPDFAASQESVPDRLLPSGSPAPNRRPSSQPPGPLSKPSGRYRSQIQRVGSDTAQAELALPPREEQERRKCQALNKQLRSPVSMEMGLPYKTRASPL